MLSFLCAVLPRDSLSSWAAINARHGTCRPREGGDPCGVPTLFDATWIPAYRSARVAPAHPAPATLTRPCVAPALSRNSHILVQHAGMTSFSFLARLSPI